MTKHDELKKKITAIKKTKTLQDAGLDVMPDEEETGQNEMGQIPDGGPSGQSLVKKTLSKIDKDEAEYNRIKENMEDTENPVFTEEIRELISIAFKGQLSEIRKSL